MERTPPRLDRLKMIMMKNLWVNILKKKKKKSEVEAASQAAGLASAPTSAPFLNARHAQFKAAEVIKAPLQLTKKNQKKKGRKQNKNSSLLARERQHRERSVTPRRGSLSGRHTATYIYQKKKKNLLSPAEETRTFTSLLTDGTTMKKRDTQNKKKKRKNLFSLFSFFFLFQTRKVCE